MTGGLPGSLAANPVIGTWVGFDEPGRVTVSVGKVEIGQGILTALSHIAAGELDVSPDRIVVRPASTAYGPAEGVTSGSMSIEQSGGALRQACAEARALLLEAAAVKLGRTVDGLTVADGDICDEHGTRLLSYWEVAGPGLLDRPADGLATPKSPDLRLADPPRLDLPDKVLGRPRFIHDLELPGQLYGRIVRPPSRGARLLGVDAAAVSGAASGVLEVVRDGDFLGVIATREEAAVRAAEAVAGAARWEERDTLPGDSEITRWLREAPSERIEVANAGVDEPEEPADPVGTVRASYSRPFLAHAAISPSCAVALWDGGRLTVWSHTQGVHPLRGAIADALRIPSDDVTVHHVESAGCYGHNGADDVAFDAALLACAVPGRPVQVVWSRADELGWSPFGSAMVVDIAASVDTDGRVVTWEHEVWSQGHVARPGFVGAGALLAAGHVEGGEPAPASGDLPLSRGGGLYRNADAIYDFPRRQVVAHRTLESPLRSSSLRSLGAFTNVFAIESFMDELAARAETDPFDYRLAQLSDPRGAAVLERARELSRWDDWPGEEDTGHGVGFARYKGSGGYCAVVAEVEAVHEVRVRRLVVVADVGRAVSRDGVANQLEGGAVQATSWTLLEQVRFDGRAVTSTDWESYPILRFTAVPRVEVDVVDRPDAPSVGAGEVAQGPTAAAIANAVRDALEVAVRDLPLTPERIVAALEA